MKPVDEMNVSELIELFIAIGDTEREEPSLFEAEMDLLDSMISE